MIGRTHGSARSTTTRELSADGRRAAQIEDRIRERMNAMVRRGGANDRLITLKSTSAETAFGALAWR
jgi:hypothetical protein